MRSNEISGEFGATETSQLLSPDRIDMEKKKGTGWERGAHPAFDSIQDCSISCCVSVIELFFRYFLFIIFIFGLVNFLLAPLRYSFIYGFLYGPHPFQRGHYK